MDAYLIVDPDSRNITIPEIESAFGVYGDNNAERKYFKSPRIVGNGIDLTECYLYVNYISASTKIGQILCDVGDAPNGTATEDRLQGTYLTRMFQVRFSLRFRRRLKPEIQFLPQEKQKAIVMSLSKALKLSLKNMQILFSS